jgi:hypothetical protein
MIGTGIPLQDGTSVLCGVGVVHSAMTAKHTLTVPGFCAVVRQSTRTMAVLYDTVLYRNKFSVVYSPNFQ